MMPREKRCCAIDEHGKTSMQFRHGNRTIAEDEAKWEADAARVREADEARERQDPGNKARLAKEYLVSLERGREHLMDQIRQSEQPMYRSKELIREIDELLAQPGVKT
jgi:hypothetical protein